MKKKTLKEAFDNLRINRDPMEKVIPIRDARYSGRDDGRGTPPNYQGPMKGAGAGTKDRMPGTEPPKSLKKYGPKQTVKKKYRNVI